MPFKLGISSCLLGEHVRYDGGHKLNRYLSDTLGRFVKWVPVCPEFECGLGVPREAMRLVGDPQNPRLMTVRSKTDLTPRMHAWIESRLEDLQHEDLCGFIFKKGSPSSGYSGVKVYTESGQSSQKGMGMFVRAFIERFPLVPVEDEGRLNDAKLRENFIERIFVYHRWKDFESQDGSLKGLLQFHARHKMLLMAHNPKALTELGRMIAHGKEKNARTLKSEYVQILMVALALIATVKKNTNVLEHLAGYFKKQLSSDEKQELKEWIERYHTGLVPLMVPLTLINHYARKYQELYLLEQVYLNPHPHELMLRNHV